MNQEVNFKFSLLKDNRPYHFVLMPGSPWADIDAVLDELKSEFAKMKAQAQEQELKKQEENSVQEEPKPQEIWE